jgi:hypothetical protein
MESIDLIKKSSKAWLVAYTTSSRFMHCPSEIYLRAAKQILRTISFGVQFKSSQNLRLHCLFYSDWGD